MNIPRYLGTVGDIAVLDPRIRQNRLASGTMANFPSGIRFTFGTRTQRHPATIVLAGTGREPVTLRIKKSEPAKVRLLILPAAQSAWKFAIKIEPEAVAALEFIFLGKAVGLSLERHASIGANAEISLSTLYLSGGAATVDDHAILLGESATLRSETLAVLNGEDTMKNVQDVLHAACKTVSEVVNSIVASDAAEAAFDVTGAIAKGNSGSDCKQQSRGVLLGEKAVIEVSPKLLIDEFDVQAGHGCAIGRINPDELYYLSSRGLDTATAKRLIVSGYTAPFIDRIGDPGMRRLADKALSNKLGGAS